MQGEASDHAFVAYIIFRKSATGEGRMVRGLWPPKIFLPRKGIEEFKPCLSTDNTYLQYYPGQS